MFDPEFGDPDGGLDYSLPWPSFASNPPPPLLAIPDHLGPCFAFDPASEAMKLLSYPDTPCNNSGGSCVSSPGCGSHVAGRGFMQRSCSALSLRRDPGYRFPYGSSVSEDASVRRVCSAGDLGRVGGGSLKGKRSIGSQLMSESNMIIEGLRRTSRYSPEERKERIERYRSKRTRRNFDKKIKAALLFAAPELLP